MVKQRKSHGSDIPQETDEIAAVAEHVTGQPKKKKTNGEVQQDDAKHQEVPLNGMLDVQRGNKPKSVTLGQLAEQQRKEKEGKPAEATGVSLSVQVTQALMSNDVVKLDSILHETRVEIIQGTLLDMQVSHAIPLLKALFERVKSRSATNIKPWLLWIQCILSLHSSYLSSMRNLETELAGLLEWMRQRLGHQQKLLELHGKLRMLGEQIERRLNRTDFVAPQPLIVFNDEVDSDMDDIESGASEQSDGSSDDEEENWWDEGELGVGGDNKDEDDDGSDEYSDVDLPTKVRADGSSRTNRVDEDDSSVEDQSDGDDSDEDDDMEIG